MKNRSLFNPLHWFSLGIGFLRDIYLFVHRNIETSIRMQLILTFVFCVLAALIIRSATMPLFANANRYPTIEYSSGIQEIDRRARWILEDINRQVNENRVALSRVPIQIEVRSDSSEVVEATPPSPTFEQRIAKIIDNYDISNPGLKILLLDLEGVVLYKSSNATESRVDLHSIIRNAMDNRLNDRRHQNQEYSSFYPLDLNNQKAYLVVSGMPTPSIIYQSDGTSPMPNLIAFIVFILLFFWITKRKMNYIGELASGIREISKGNLHYRVSAKSRDELGSLAESINRMAGELQQTLEEERRAEATKNELITNVSHDLRTPLTLIMGYLRLLKDHNYESQSQADSYINIAYGKSEKLKSLIDDLFEYTKLSNKGDTLRLDTVCLNELLEQLIEEMIGYAEENDLSLVRIFPPEKLRVQVDADKMIRVFDNLLTNAVKYSRKPGTVRVFLLREGEYATVRISNNGPTLSQQEVDRLFDRFYRIDTARSSENGGSGLGLAIAKSIIDYHGGEIWAESEGDEIRFWVRLKLAE